MFVFDIGGTHRQSAETIIPIATITFQRKAGLGDGVQTRPIISLCHVSVPRPSSVSIRSPLYDGALLFVQSGYLHAFPTLSNVPGDITVESQLLTISGGLTELSASHIGDSVNETAEVGIVNVQLSKKYSNTGHQQNKSNFG